jgi:hypothetical protein
MWRHLGKFFADMFRHTVGKLTGGLSILLGIFPVISPSFFAGGQGLLHSRTLWWASAAFAFLFAAKAAWSENYRELEKVKNELLVAINKDRPEVTALFSVYSYAPKGESDYDYMVEITNRGGSDAWGIEIEAVIFDGGILDFINPGILGPNRPRPIVHFVVDRDGHHKGTIETVLKSKLNSKGRADIHLYVSWKDSSGNSFSSVSQITYFSYDRSATTEILGSIQMVPKGQVLTSESYAGGVA